MISKFYSLMLSFVVFVFPFCFSPTVCNADIQQKIDIENIVEDNIGRNVFFMGIIENYIETDDNSVYGFVRSEDGEKLIKFSIDAKKNNDRILDSIEAVRVGHENKSVVFMEGVLQRVDEKLEVLVWSVSIRN